jgi:perosamine synthetase
MKKILITKPSIDHNDLIEVNRAIVDGWGENYLYFNKKFEDNFKSYIGAKYCIATSSCTGATHIALKGLNIKKGDEIILPNITWFSCASVIDYMGAKPVFVDVDVDTFCINPNEIEKKITKKTKAIFIVHLYGAVCNIKKIRAIANKNKILIIEDCAESIGSEYDNKKTGNFGDVSVFSFHGSKTITTGGEGGAILTNNKNLYKRMIKISNHGKNIDKIFFQDEVGLKYKMSTIQCAMGISQIKKINKLNKKKNVINNYFKKKLEKLPIKFQSSDKNSTPYYWMPTFYVNKKNFDRDDFINFMKNKKVSLRPTFYQLSNFKFYKSSSKKNDFSISNIISKNGVNLPSYYGLEKKHLDYIIKNILNYFFLNKIT